MTRYNHYFADVSAFQPNVNMHDYADAGHVAIAIKATEGLHYINPFHRGQALAAGMRHVGVIHYHFGRPDENANAALEADHFLAATAGLLGPYDYVVLDLERATPQGWSHDPLWSREFDGRIQERSRFFTILYASRSVLEGSDSFLQMGNRRVWDADWSSHPDFAPHGYTVAFRQYTDGTFGPEPHGFAGIGRCDGNIMSHDIFTHLLQHRH